MAADYPPVVDWPDEARHARLTRIVALRLWTLLRDHADWPPTVQLRALAWVTGWVAGNVPVFREDDGATFDREILPLLVRDVRAQASTTRALHTMSATVRAAADEARVIPPPTQEM